MSVVGNAKVLLDLEIAGQEGVTVVDVDAFEGIVGEGVDVREDITVLGGVGADLVFRLLDVVVADDLALLCDAPGRPTVSATRAVPVSRTETNAQLTAVPLNSRGIDFLVVIVEGIPEQKRPAIDLPGSRTPGGTSGARGGRKTAWCGRGSRRKRPAAS
ncbi:hypothetical protein [Actinomadura madurae]|uniref:hypothetical protein n=1 Tax=Actinomadura madurae TaxID=1993 RepID=UPI0020D246B0|nr:hypothetical protein [Actinomadura madurae]MCP9979133.1 hypothetical protein [Actinomadura madurae]